MRVLCNEYLCRLQSATQGIPRSGSSWKWRKIDREDMQSLRLKISYAGSLQQESKTTFQAWSWFTDCGIILRDDTQDGSFCNIRGIKVSANFIWGLEWQSSETYEVYTVEGSVWREHQPRQWAVRIDRQCNVTLGCRDAKSPVAAWWYRCWFDISPRRVQAVQRKKADRRRKWKATISKRRKWYGHRRWLWVTGFRG